MSSPAQPAHLSNHQRNTLSQIFQHPAGHDIEWRGCVSPGGASRRTPGGPPAQVAPPNDPEPVPGTLAGWAWASCTVSRKAAGRPEVQPPPASPKATTGEQPVL